MLFDDSRTGHQGGDFLFFDNFPRNEIKHIGVIQIQTNHFGGTPGGSAGFDSSGGAVANAQE